MTGNRGFSRAAFTAVAAGLIVVGPGTFGAAPRGGLHAAGLLAGDDGGDRRGTMSWDVAIDCRTWRFNGGVSFQDFGRGDGFVADGRIFPSGSLQPGPQANDPNDPGSVGKWVERGTMAATLVDILSGTRPAFFATWFNMFDDGSELVADGAHPDPGRMVVVGGTGTFTGVNGVLSDAILGTNGTGCPNLRLTIRLHGQSPQ